MLERIVIHDSAGETEKWVQKYRCMKCGCKFNDAEREFCGAPFVENKTVAAARQIKMMQSAKMDGHPLTDKEEIIDAGVATIEEKMQEREHVDPDIREVFPGEEMKQQRAMQYVSMSRSKSGNHMARTLFKNLGGISQSELSLVDKKYRLTHD